MANTSGVPSKCQAHTLINSYETGAIIIAVLQIRKLRHVTVQYQPTLVSSGMNRKKWSRIVEKIGRNVFYLQRFQFFGENRFMHYRSIGKKKTLKKWNLGT